MICYDDFGPRSNSALRWQMDDSEIFACLEAGDPAGLAAAYDRYAAPLYGYCRWMLRDPGQAAKALRETFTVVARKGGSPKDASQLRASLYAIARDRCYRRLRTAEPGFDEIADGDGWEGAGAPAGARPAARGGPAAQISAVTRVI